jgi:exopolysaccharide biosynthesis predicted pyruvyltransferase EpsI
MDHYWKSALLAALDIAPFVDVVFTPSKLFPYSRKFYPLEFSLSAANQRVGFCVQKDQMHRLAKNLINQIINPDQITYTNDVFVVGYLNPDPSIQWFYQQERFDEFNKLRVRVAEDSAGKNETPYWKINSAKCKRKVLVVGATNMGNVGDDLLAYSIETLIKNTNPDCGVYFSDSRITPADLKTFDAVIVGGGGIIYSKQSAGNNDTPNLANYLKIPFWAAEFSIPCYLMGVGVQGKPTHLSEDPVVEIFLQQSLPSVKLISVRDSASKTVLTHFYPHEIKLLPDLVFSLSSLYSQYKQVRTNVEQNSVVFIGEVFSTKLSFFNVLIKNQPDLFFDLFNEANFHFAIMSTDDLVHSDMFVKTLEARGLKCVVHDLRKSSYTAAIDFFASMSGVITTRFHGLVLSILAGCPALSLDVSTGKHALLFRDYFPSISDNLIDEHTATASIIEKINTLTNNPSALLPAIHDVESVCTASLLHKDVVANALSSIASS